MSLKSPAPADEPAQIDALSFGEWELLLSPPQLRRAGLRVPIQRQPLKLLALLASRQGALVTHDEIRRALWPDRHVDFARGTHVCIRQIRSALGDGATALIESVPGEGYRFAAPVRALRQELPRRNASWAPRLAVAGLAATAIIVVASFWPREPSAPAAYLRGAYLLEQPGEDAARRSLRLFAEAQAEAPGYAPAYLAAAQAHARLDQLDEAEQMARAALRRDRRLAEAHLVLGRVTLVRDWDWAGARRHFDNALRLDAGLAEAHQGLATAALLTGRNALAVRHMARAYALDPGSTLIAADYGWMELSAGRAEHAIELCEQALQLEPASIDARVCLIRALSLQNRQNDIVAHASSIMVASNAAAGEIAVVVAAHDKAAAFERWRLARYERSDRVEPVSPALRASLHAYLGGRETALRLLEQALAEQDRGLPLILTTRSGL